MAHTDYRSPHTAPIQAIACNYAEGTKVVRKGALAFVRLTNPGNANKHINILVRSRGGRWIEKWERIDRLVNFRLKTVVPEMGRIYHELQLSPNTSREVNFMEQASIREKIGRLAGMRPALVGNGYVEKGLPFDEEWRRYFKKGLTE